MKKKKLKYKRIKATKLTSFVSKLPKKKNKAPKIMHNLRYIMKISMQLHYNTSQFYNKQFGVKTCTIESQPQSANWFGRKRFQSKP